ncbi:uncharacterized protein IL334_006477 [Kwoniella shivajii]|uniref:Trafficking protein particle complex II-specific subunit 65 IgD3 domain-containing protein n=1 Tax=Kwoniella shivajii TaxID=564305 RepID=A0ABZ1D624_9TREE|nr:hypothetical protein IL334_006477 [Kwoniella shivajii]
MPSPNPSAHYEALFHSSSLNLLIPEISSLPTHENENDHPELWWDQVDASLSRTTAFLDEKLFYLVSMHLSNESLRDLPGTPALDAKEPTSEMLRFLGRLQLTMTASFIPSLPNPNQNSTRTPTSATLAPPSHLPVTPSGTTGDTSVPPVTPNPFPAMNKEEEQYAHIDGVVVWDGAVEEVPGPWEESETKHGKSLGKSGSGSGSGSGRKIIRVQDGWEVIWKGEVPIAYVRTQIQNPLLALTASATLRDTSHTKTHRRNAQSIDAMSIRSGNTIRTDGTELEYEEEDNDEFAGMEDIDLLGGLTSGQDIMPATRLAPSLREDLSVPLTSINSPIPLSAMTPISAPTIITPSTTSSGPSRERGFPPTTVQPEISTTLRKSYRRVLSLAPGLRVRMRTLFLPQLLSGSIEEEEGEKRIVLCIEIENSPESSLSNGFQVSEIKVDIGGKGGKASTELVCQPDTIDFPMKLGSTEQYNLLYKVSIASPTEGNSREGMINGIEEAVSKSLGRGDEIRPVSIVLIGRPFTIQQKGEIRYQTKEFHSRWNCSLDLTPFYSSNSTPTPIIPRNRRSKVILQPPNAIAGDKRYSLAHLLSVEKEREREREKGSQGKRPLMPSQSFNANNQNIPGSRVSSLALGRQPNQNQNQKEKLENGLLISVKLLPQSQPQSQLRPQSSEESESSIGPLETFSLEIFVHNRSEEIRRFRLCIPPRDGIVENQIRDIWDKRRKRRNDEPDWGVDDSVLKQSLSAHLASSPALIPLENDIRCGPLLPSASLSARIRFLALREGVHKIEKLRIIGTGDEVDFTLSPVLDVIVGRGK